MSNSISTGDAPSQRLYFDGCDEKFELWEVKFKAYLRIKNLHTVLSDGRETAKFRERNERVYAELVQVLDDKSLQLIMREAEDDGKRALELLEQHYSGSSKPRIIALYTELTTLQKVSEETATDYFLRAEKTATALNNAGETISDGLLVAMCLKGLPTDYSAFSTVITQRSDEVSFSEFKSALKSFEETMKSKQSQPDVKVMMCENKIVCFKCGRSGHKQYQCKSKSINNIDSNDGKTFGYSKNKWCNICKNKTHFTKDCRRNRNKSESVNNISSSTNASDHQFAMKVNEYDSLDSLDVVNNNLLVDCGATSHIITNKDLFVKFCDKFNSSSHYIELADGSRKNNIVYGKGDACVHITDRAGNDHEILLKNALCIPSYKQNIFSVRSATDNGVRINFASDNNELITQNGTVFDIKRKGNLYYLYNIRNENCTVRSLQEWHETLGHCNIRDILKLEHVVKDMKITNKDNFECDVCIKGKMCKFRNREPDDKAKKVLDLVHCDLAGPIDPVAKDGFKYAIVFVDDFSGALFVYLLKNKSDAVEALRKFLADVEPQGKVKRLRTDNGTEFTNHQFREILLTNKIKQEYSSPYSPHQNGTAERSWRSIFEMTRCLLMNAKLPKNLWAYAVKAAAYIRNRCFNNRTETTPYESFMTKAPKISHMQPFGSKCFAYTEEKKKLDDRCDEGIFVGYDSCSPAYLVYFPLTKTVRRVRLVKFMKKLEHIESKEQIPHAAQEPEQSRESPVETESSDATRRYPERLRTQPSHLSDYITCNDDMSNIAKCAVDYCYHVDHVPSSYDEAISSPESLNWKRAMREEIESLEESDTFLLTTLPEGCKTVGSRWVYSIKRGPDESVRFKARLVARGFTQREGLDYHETFSPTARITSVRMLLQLAAHHNYRVRQMDVKNAYLNAELSEIIYLEIPDGSKSNSNSCDKRVWKLNKSLYGLKQSGRNWNHVLNSFLISQSFIQSIVDPCVYTKHVEQCHVILIVFVDDIIIASNDDTLLNNCRMSLCDRFKMKDFGELTYFLGIDFKFINHCIEMNQTKCIQKILERFQMSDCKVKSTPCDLSFTNLSADDSNELADPKLFKEIVGSLIYVMTCTRPDITYVVTRLSQCMNRPTKADLNAAKHVLRYLKGTMNKCLKFTRSQDELKLIGYSDSDWAGSNDRKSTSGYAFTLNSDGPLISYKSKKQNVVALSSCEAEYVAITVAVQEAKFLKQLYSDMTCSILQCVTVFVDNQGAISLGNNPVHHQRSKHIDVKYHFIRLEIQNKSIELKYIPTSENVADVFTKPMSKVKLNKLSILHG